MSAQDKNEFDLQELGSCIKRKRQREQLSLRDAAVQSRVSFPTLSRLENAQITPDLRTLTRLCRWLQAPLEQFVGPAPPRSNVTEVFTSHNATRLSRPLYADRVAAGFPSPAENYFDERLDLNQHLIRHPLATFFVRVAGDSMIGERIFDGDLLVVDRAETVRPGQIVIAVVNGEFCVKRYEKIGGRVVLRSANPAYPDIELTPEDDWAIWGRVVHSIHRH